LYFSKNCYIINKILFITVVLYNVLFLNKFWKDVFYINLHEIINSIDSTLENNIKSYTNSFADKFIDELKNHLIQNELPEKFKNIPNGTLFTLDRYEGNFVVCENRTTDEIINIPKTHIDTSAKEGDILKFENNIFKIDIAETKKHNDLMQNFFKNNNKI